MYTLKNSFNFQICNNCLTSKICVNKKFVVNLVAKIYVLFYIMHSKYANILLNL